MDIQNLIQFLSSKIENLKSDMPILVAIDGVDASGKTTLSRQLVETMQNKSLSVIKASIDGFHNSKEERYRLGSNSPEGYYRYSFNYNSLINYLLKPIKQNKSYKTAVYDFKTESVVNQDLKKADKNSILIMEGVFLQRPELYSYWDYKIFLHVEFDEVIKRTQTRDKYLFGSAKEIENRYRNKYIPGQQMYLLEADPYRCCDLVINNNDYNNPYIVETIEEIQKLKEKAISFV